MVNFNTMAGCVQIANPAIVFDLFRLLTLAKTVCFGGSMVLGMDELRQQCRLIVNQAKLSTGRLNQANHKEIIVGTMKNIEIQIAPLQNCIINKWETDFIASCIDNHIDFFA